MRSAERAWFALAIGVFAYELFAKEGELLSHQVDRWLESHPVITSAVVTMTAAHLLNILPQRADPWAWMFAWRKLVS
jgi:hypothetical protein